MFGGFKKSPYLCNAKQKTKPNRGVAQLVRVRVWGA